MSTASRGQLTKLAILYGEVGYTDRLDRLDHAAAFTGRDLTSSAELTREQAHRLIEHLEARVAGEPTPAVPEPRPPVDDPPPAPVPAVPRGVGVKRHDPGCGPDGRHYVPEGPGVQRCPCGTVSRVPAVGRYCLPEGTCYCGDCPHYTPPALPNYRAARAELAEKAARRNEWKNR